jgi:hypothetical protein
MGKFNGFQKSDDVPEWAQCLSLQEYLWFKDAVRAYFIDNSIEADLYFDDGYVDVKNGLYPKMQHGLHNLVFRCEGEGADVMVETCGHWFEQLRQMWEEAGMVKSRPLEEIEHLIEVRIFQRMGGVHANENVLNEELCLVPVYSLSNSIKTIDAEDYLRFGISQEELFDRALARTLGRIKTFPVLKVDRPEISGALLIADQENVFVTTGIVALEFLTELSPTHGFLVAIPNRHHLLVYPLEPGVKLEIPNAMARIARSRFEAGEGGISPSLFWVQGETIRRLEDSNGPTFESLSLAVGWT